MKQFMTKKMKNQRHEIIVFTTGESPINVTNVPNRASVASPRGASLLPKTMDILIKPNIGTLVSDQ